MTTRKQTRGLTAKEVRARRAALGIPSEGAGQRAWIHYQLQMRGWTAAKVARDVDASETTVSVIYTGARPAGDKAALVRRLTAKILKIPAAVLFPEVEQDAARREKELARKAAEREALRDVRREHRRVQKQRERRRHKLEARRREREAAGEAAREAAAEQEPEARATDHTPDVEGVA